MSTSAFRHAGSAFLAIILAFFALATSADPYPEFEGIYFKMNDGSFIQVATGETRGTRSVQFHVGWTHTNALGSDFFGWEDVQNLPVIDLNNAGPIVVIGNKPAQLVLFPMAEVAEYFSEFTNNPDATATYSVSGQSSTVAASDLPPLFIRQNCGVGNDRFIQTKPIDAFITEFYPKPGRGWPQVSSGMDCVNLPSKAVVMEIAIDGSYRAQFLTRVGKEEFESSTAQNETAVPSNQNVVLIADTPDLFNVFEYIAAGACKGSCALDGVSGTYRIFRDDSVKTLLPQSRRIFAISISQGRTVVLGSQALPIPDIAGLAAYRVKTDKCQGSLCGNAIVLLGDSEGYFADFLVQ